MNEKHVQSAMFLVDGIVDYWQKQVDDFKEESFVATVEGDTARAMKSALLAQYLSGLIEDAEDYLSRDN